MILTRGLAPGAGALRLGACPFFAPNSVHSQLIARLAHCHWSSSIVRGRNR